jgi:hypothetical protein
MAVKPSREDGHLIVAAVRVLSHNAAKPPTPEEIADLLGLAPEFARNLVVALGDEGILRVVVNPFEIRAEVGDYTRLEDLPAESTAPTIQDELEDFVKRKQEAIEETEKMLNLDEIEKKKREKLSRLEDEMKRMKDRGQSPPFR